MTGRWGNKTQGVKTFQSNTSRHPIGGISTSSRHFVAVVLKVNIPSGRWENDGRKFKMDNEVLEALRKARRSYLELANKVDVVNDELAKKPQPHDVEFETKVVSGFRCWGLSIGLLLVWFIICLIIAALGSTDDIKNKWVAQSFMLCFIPIAIWILSLVTWPIRLAIKGFIYIIYKLKFINKIKQWQKRINEKKEVMMNSAGQHLDDIEALTGILPEKYLVDDYNFYRKHPLVAIIQYIEDMRADTIKEAINLYEFDEREARRDNENADHRKRLEQHAENRAQAAERMADEQARSNAKMLRAQADANRAQEDTLRAQKDANRIAKRRASAAEDAAANAKKTADEAETIRRIHTGERGV